MAALLRHPLALTVAALATFPIASAGQRFVGAGFQQAFTPTSTLESPSGFSVTLGLDRVWGPVGLSAGYQRVSEGAGVISRTCGIFSCLEGPFDESHSLETFDLGVSFRPPAGSLFDLSLTGHVSVSSQSERLEHVHTGEVRNSDEGGTDTGLGLSARLELPVTPRFSPYLGVRLDHLFASPCFADASCFPDRNVTRLTVGLLWHP